MSGGYCDEIRSILYKPNCAVLTEKRTLLAMLLSELPPSCVWASTFQIAESVHSNKIRLAERVQPMWLKKSPRSCI